MGNLIELGIRDNGQGFDPREALAKDQKAKGMGLSSRKEPVESSSGFFAVDSQKGTGTLVQASWAL
jgi:signal transduction histidine kinase